MLDRWMECDREPDVIKRLDCRTSRMNDFIHRMDRDILHLKRQVKAGMVLQTIAGLGGLATVISTVHNLTH